MSSAKISSVYIIKYPYLVNLSIIINSPRSPTAHVHVAAGKNIIWNLFLLMAKCRGNGKEPSQRVQRAVVTTLWC